MLTVQNFEAEKKFIEVIYIEKCYFLQTFHNFLPCRELCFFFFGASGQESECLE